VSHDETVRGDGAFLTVLLSGMGLGKGGVMYSPKEFLRLISWRELNQAIILEELPL
jgi:hypothetical protein